VLHSLPVIQFISVSDYNQWLPAFSVCFDDFSNLLSIATTRTQLIIILVIIIMIVFFFVRPGSWSTIRFLSIHLLLNNWAILIKIKGIIFILNVAIFVWICLKRSFTCILPCQLQRTSWLRPLHLLSLVCRCCIVLILLVSVSFMLSGGPGQNRWLVFKSQWLFWWLFGVIKHRNAARVVVG